MDYKGRDGRDGAEKHYGPGEEYAPDVCPPFGSPEFLKKFPVDPTTIDGFRRILAARLHGYGD